MSSSQDAGGAGIIPFLERRPGNLNETYAERDRMVDGDPELYLRFGANALGNMRVALALARVEEVRSILDFPSGYGRVLRMLRAEFPDAEIVACDVDRAGVDFCRDTFGARGVYATPDPRDIKLEGEFDLIWCGSLLTHMPAEKWPVFLRFFESHLAAGGVLVFSTHGRQTAEVLDAGWTNPADPDVRTPPFALLPDEAKGVLKDFRETGFGYQKYPFHEEYGFSLSRPDWVAGRILGHPSLRLLLLTEAGWGGHQDIVACVKVDG